MNFSQIIGGLGISALLTQAAIAGEMATPSSVEPAQMIVAPHVLPKEAVSAETAETMVRVSDVPTSTTKASTAEPYTIHSTLDDVKAIKWEGLGAFAGITALGVNSWDWGSSGFHTNSEHWFGKGTGSGGSDKLGHAFTSYALTNAFAERLQSKGRSPERAALSASLLTSALMLYVEAFDGVSGDHGFSYEDAKRIRA